MDIISFTLVLVMQSTKNIQWPVLYNAFSIISGAYTKVGSPYKGSSDSIKKKQLWKCWIEELKCMRYAKPVICSEQISLFKKKCKEWNDNNNMSSNGELPGWHKSFFDSLSPCLYSNPNTSILSSINMHCVWQREALILQLMLQSE